ncbi:MAG: D-alanyl-D-alanine carboxypeptidase/D-alanyl-D-alanine-endopeptidase [Methanomicrobiales archaeon]|nr:D-alanyl-D-alanine carboxypeptidase/D-alanyl-D-alanine-endopeptidase [Methanomicrobiales archaeon]
MAHHPKSRGNSGIYVCILLMALFLAAGCTTAERASPAASAFETDLAKITSSPRYAHSGWGIIVIDPATGTTLYEQNADQMFLPASTTKLFSSAAVLETLGPEHRFRTPVYETGSSDGGKNLVLVASGDLSMGGRTLPGGSVEYTNMDHGDAAALSGAILTTTDPLAGLNDLARQVRASGITKISDVVIDDRLFEPENTLSADLLSPIVINDNLVDIILSPGMPGSAPSLAMRPETRAFRLENRLITGPAGSELAIASTENPAGTIVVSGSVPADAGIVNQTYAVRKPAAFARTLFIEALERQGVEVAAPATGENPAAKLPPQDGYANNAKVAELVSPPLIEDVKLTLKVSQNMHANHYIMLLALADNKSTFFDGMQKEGRILNSLGLDTRAVALVDGEGTDANRVTPRAAAQLLTLVAQRPYAEQYVKAQPILGVDGSLATACSLDNPACGHVYAKTGTNAGYDLMNGRPILYTKGLAGYIDTKSGRRVVFAEYARNVPYSDLNDMMAVGADLGSVAGLIYQYY